MQSTQFITHAFRAHAGAGSPVDVEQ